MNYSENKEMSSLISSLLHMKKYDAVNKATQIIHGNDKNIVINEMNVDGVRLMPTNNDITILYPHDIDTIMENAVADAIVSGDIFDDAEKTKDSAEYVKRIALPVNTIEKTGGPDCASVTDLIKPIIAKMDSHGHCNIDEPDMMNGVNCVHDLCRTPHNSHEEVRDVINHYLAHEEREHDEHHHDDEHEHHHHHHIERSPFDIKNIMDAVAHTKTVVPENCCCEESWEYVEIGDEHVVSEFVSKRPKKLKQIPRDLIVYINEQIKQIHDKNDQSVLAGYTSNKLEFVDFYITVLDTHDERYIVPHTREYLVNMRRELNDLLAKILRVIPVNKNDTVWKVNYPDGWEG